jgi:hypothetical protein
MADSRIPERYLSDKRVLRLSHGARSSLFMATTWSVSNRTDGRIERADLALIPTFVEGCVSELLAHELWIEDGKDAWIILDFERDQTSRSEFEALDNARRRERDKKRRQRALKKDASPGTIPGDSPPGQHRQGKSQARQVLEPGQDDRGGVNPSTGEVSSWPTAKPGEPGAWVQTGEGEFSEVGAA